MLVDVVETPEEAAALEVPPLVVRQNLAAAIPGAGPLEVERLGEGHSNITFLVTRGADRWVLRRPPRPPLPPTAHDVLREYRVLSALAGAEVRTPKPVMACKDVEVIGAPFYLMELVEGAVVRHALPAELDNPAERRRIAEELVDALVELHAVDWRACGLEDFGKPTGYVERQVRRWTGQWEQNRTRELSAIEQVGGWLAANVPDSPAATIVHGDYKLDNVILAPGAPARVAAIFDWEMATIGDPLADVGYMAATYVERDDPNEGLLGISRTTRAEGFPSRAELIARYEARSGRSMGNLPWYQALALWKLAILLEGSYKRLLAGTTDDPFFELLDEGVPLLAEQALAVTRTL